MRKALFYSGSIIMIILIVLLLGYYCWVPKIIESRAKDLGLMQYSGGKFVAKDSIKISGWDLYYLTYGNMDGY